MEKLRGYKVGDREMSALLKSKTGFTVTEHGKAVKEFADFARATEFYEALRAEQMAVRALKRD